MFLAISAIWSGPLNSELVDVFLKNGPSVVRFLGEHASFISPAIPAPDYRQESPGATLGGRALR
jgi:hypothetical protein